MAYLGQTHTGTYMTAPHLTGASTPGFLPTLNSMPSAHMSYMPYDTYPAPTPLVRSLTTLPWNPSTYWGNGRIAPTIPNSRSMPEPKAMANRLTQLDSVKVPPTFASARNARYTRYTPDDWRASNMSNYMASDRVRGGSERVRYDAARLCREIDDKTSRTQTDVGKKLGDRIGDIQFWKTEINNETDRVISESDALARAKGVLEKTLAETENPLHVAQECLYFREKRQGVDLVHDEVEKKLIEVCMLLAPFCT
jgi:tektin-3